MGLDIAVIDPKTGKKVRVDGCCTLDRPNPYCVNGDASGDLIEAKARGYQSRMRGKGWQVEYGGVVAIKRQMMRQSRAAALRGVHALFYFAEPRPAEYFKKFARKNYPNVEVFYSPGR